MALRVFGLGLALLVLGSASRPTSSALPRNVQDEMESAYQKAMAECRQFRDGDRACVTDQFHANVRWYVLKEQDFRVGPPGIPGPLIAADGATADPNATR